MRIAHGDAGHGVGLPVNVQRLIDNVAGCGNGNLRPVKDGLAHIDRHTGHSAIFNFEKEHLQPGVGVHPERIVGRNAVVVEIFPDATNPVTAHLPAAAIRVIHLHAGMGRLRRADQNKPISTYTRPALTHLTGDPDGVGKLGVKRIDIDIVVADAVHLGKRKLHAYYLPLTAYRLERVNVFGISCLSGEHVYPLPPPACSCQTNSTVFETLPK